MMMFTISPLPVVSILSFLVLRVPAVYAAEREYSRLKTPEPVVACAGGTSSNAGERPKIGLALSGGGARGVAHVGVLKVLEKHRIPVDYIAGTSMGAIVGGLYASGMSAKRIEEAIYEVDWEDAFIDRTRRQDRSFRRKRDDDFYLIKNKPGLSGGKIKFPPAVIDGQKIDLLLKRYTLPVVTVRDFDDLNIPYRSIAADLVTGEAVVLDHGDLALAIRASMTIPVAFAPRVIDDTLLVDGGISICLPVDVVRRMGADVVIAVDISTLKRIREQLHSALDITYQLISILTRRNTEKQIASLTDTDVFIQGDLGDITTASFDRVIETIPIGVSAAEAVLGELSRLSLSEEEYRKHLDERTARMQHVARPIINEVRIINQSRLADGVIAAKLKVETGTPIDVDRLESDLGRIYGLDLFESVYYDIEKESDHTTLTVTAREKSWGPNYLQFGVAVFEDFEGPNFNLAAAYTRTAVNRLNGEWRTGFQVGQEPGVFTEFYQPLDHALRNFVHVEALFTEQADNVFDADGNKLTELGLRRGGIGLAGGRELGTWGEIRAGILREAGEIKIQVGDPTVPDVDFNTGEAFIQFAVDELDNVKFPSSGGNLRIRLTAGLENLGSDNEYEQGIIEGSYAYTLGRFTGLFGGLFATTRDSDAPYQSLFRLGGFSHLSGLEQYELRGQHSALLSGTFYHRIVDFKMMSLYGGASIEYGNVFQDRKDIEFDGGIVAGSIFLGIDTPIGPIHLAYGRAEGGRNNYYFILGQSLLHRRAGFRCQ
ncbi:MAG: patatin-like phospholipase family protein [bacterium]|nr:MAG: patatin-like phospholipase family protein [bacterium]